MLYNKVSVAGAERGSVQILELAPWVGVSTAKEVGLKMERR